MIPSVTHGGNTPGVLYYLLGPGRREEHEDAHLVAGDAESVALYGGRHLAAAAGDARDIGRHLDAPRIRFDRAPLRRGEPAHVWHCSLSLPAGERLDDAAWDQVCEEFVAEMGFEDCRWVAIRHGDSSPQKPGEEPKNHAHIIVQRVQEDGRIAGIHNDFHRSQECARGLERRHGLQELEGRAHQRGARATSTRVRQRADAHRYAGQEPAGEALSEQLHDRVRASAQAAVDEQDFVVRLRAAGLGVRPRMGDAGARVVGFSVTPPGSSYAFAAGRLAKDLTLPRLRATYGWDPRDRVSVEEWQRARDGLPSSREPRSPQDVSDDAWDRALRGLRDLRQTASHGPATAGAGEAHRAYLGGQAAGLCGEWARTGPDEAAAFGQLGRVLAAGSQVRSATAQAYRPDRSPKLLAGLVATVSRPQNTTLYWYVLARELALLSQTVSDLHAAGGERQHAQALRASVEALAPATAALSDQHAAVDPAWAQSRRAAAIADVAKPSAAPTAPRPASTPARPASPSPRPYQPPRPRRRS